MQTWLVLSNCQSRGLANSLTLQYPDVHVIAIELGIARREQARVLREVNTASMIFVSHGFRRLGLLNAGSATIDLPNVTFAGYHPDLVYIQNTDNTLIKSPLGVSNSAICFAAFKKGYTVTDTQALFVGKNYERYGFLSVWEPERQKLERQFERCNIDGSKLFRRWTLGEPFMHNTIYPKIRCFFDIATELLKGQGLEPRKTNIYPMDNMVNSAIFPIYDELAESFGVRGSYLFKPIMTYNLMTLEEFIKGSFTEYLKYDVANLSPDASSDLKIPKCVQQSLAARS